MDIGRWTHFVNVVVICLLSPASFISKHVLSNQYRYLENIQEIFGSERHEDQLSLSVYVSIMQREV